MRKEILLLSPPANTNRTAEENLGLEYLGSESINNGHLVTYLDGFLLGLSVEQTTKRILQNNPEVLGISPSMDSINNVLKIVSGLRDQGYSGQIILGGIYASFESESLLLASNGSINGVITGEADDTFQQYLKGNISSVPGAVYLEGKEIKKIKNELVPDNLDRLPFPIRESLTLIKTKKTPSHIMGSRGCYGNCSFCSVACFQKFSSEKRWRGRSPESIVDELVMLNRSGENMVKFIDDNFFGGKDQSRELKIARLMRERGIDMRFRLSLRVNDVTDEAIKELKKSGLFAVSLGVESFVKRKLRDFSKGTTVEQNTKAIEILKNNGIFVQMGHIMFDPFITIPELEEELFFLNETNWAVTKGICTQLFAAEGTEITNRIRREVGFVGKDGTNNLYQIVDKKARSFYEAIKIWAKYNSVLYDMAIDPISAPKNISHEGHCAFQQVCMDLKQLDLEVAAILIDKVKTSSPSEVMTLSFELINKNRDRLNDISTKVRVLYKQHGLTYEAVSNKHIY